MKESTIERAVCNYAKSKGCLVLKLAGPNQKGQPDRMFIKDGKMLFIEFKAPGKDLSPLQRKWFTDLQAQKMCVFFCDSIHDGKWAIDLQLCKNA